LINSIGGLRVQGSYILMKQLDWKPSAIGMLLATNVMRGKYAIFQMINGYISLFQAPISMNFEIRNSQKKSTTWERSLATG